MNLRNVLKGAHAHNPELACPFEFGISFTLAFNAGEFRAGATL
jgi:hypothetical protein